MSSVSTTSIVLAENMRVTRSMSKIAARGCAAVIVRRPLSNLTPSVNSVALLPAKRKASAAKPPPAKPAVSVPFPYKNGFGFSLGDAPYTPKERERLRKERLAFFCRARAFQQRENLPKIILFSAPTTTACGEENYTREYVGRRTGFYRIISSPTFLAPPATNYGGQVLDPDMFPIVPEIREHVPPAWDEWCAPDRPAEVDESMLFVPETTSSGDFYAEDLARYFPFLWRDALAEYTREVLIKRTKRRMSKFHAVGGRRRL